MPTGFITSSAPFNPTQISGCLLWLDGSDPAATGGGATVSTWLDKSTVKANATYVTAPPPLVSSAINGLSALSFTGTEKLTGSISITGTTLSIFSVFTLNSSSGAAGRLISLAASGTIDYANNAYTALQRRVSPQLGIYRNGTEISSPITYSTNTLHTAYYDGTNEYVYTNGGTVYTNASSGTFAISAYMIGANLGYSSDNQPWNGYIGEVIVYNIALSAPQRQQVEGYLAQKWGLQTNLPGTHAGATGRIYPTLVKQIITPQPYYTAFKPTQIAGCQLWLDGADPAGTGIVPAQDSQIGTWVDKSGNSRSMTVQGNAAYITYKKVNGINSVWFNNPSANNAYMKNTSFQVIQNGTIFMVFVPLAYSATWNFLWSWNPTVSNYLVPGARIQQNNNNLQLYLTWYGSGNYGTVGNGTTYISYFDWTNTATMPINWSLNGTLTPTSSTVGSVINNTSLTEFDLGADLGAPAYANMYLSEMIIYNSVLTATQRQQVESYLAQKWGLTSSLPAGHLNATQPAGKPVAATQTLINSTLGTLSQFVGVASLSYLPLAANSTDIGGTPRTVTTNGTVTYTTVAGKQCAYFSNSLSNYLSFPYTAQTQLTICYWLYCIDTSYYTAVSINDGAALLQSTTLQVDINPSTNNTIIYTAMPAQWTNQPTGSYGGPGQWVHFAITVNYTTYFEQVYINGNSIATATGSGSPSTTQSQIWLGRSGDNARAYYGYLRHFCTFPTVLTQAQIQAVKTYTT